MQIKAFGITDVGLKREGDEDSFSTEDELGLFIVADGMGGHLAGEVASHVAVEMINKSYSKWLSSETKEEDLFGPPDQSLSRRGNYIQSSIRLANRVIYEMAMEYEQYHGMGTTVVSLIVAPDLIIAANVGDSRIYLVRDGRIERLSKDHTIVAEQTEMGMMTTEEAEASPLKHILTRNLGSAETVDADVFEIEPANNDRFILCSDGLTDLVNDDEILEMTLQENQPENLCQQFIDRVLKRGAHDNTTIISVFI
ncbi:MAG: Stp1/IreP family PP2C-type Ser/Thr phosphatase, partial [Deltaproteobacteria bacterium]|nr:Stp1/IreP family PP2C-type Ser/Thr phosphatase [Deltaproteobacteria bacterium]